MDRFEQRCHRQGSLTAGLPEYVADADPSFEQTLERFEEKRPR